MNGIREPKFSRIGRLDYLLHEELDISTTRYSTYFTLFHLQPYPRSLAFILPLPITHLILLLFLRITRCMAKHHLLRGTCAQCYDLIPGTNNESHGFAISPRFSDLSL